jgi:hypothetical protein
VTENHLALVDIVGYYVLSVNKQDTEWAVMEHNEQAVIEEHNVVVLFVIEEYNVLVLLGIAEHNVLVLLVIEQNHTLAVTECLN